jgi:SAM-dependent methyltransferase
MQNYDQRWKQAQDTEKQHWYNIAKKIADGRSPQLDWYGWKANRLQEKMAEFNHSLELESATIVEIGSGPVGVVSGMDVGERYAVEPLGDYFEANPVLTQQRRPDVTYKTARGENLPFADRFAGFVIIDNVLDHSENPSQILREASRILDDNGLLYIGVNIRSLWGSFLHKIINVFNIDAAHPHEYDYTKIRDFLFQNAFKINWETIENKNEVKKNNFKKKGFKGKAKVVLGLTEYYYEAFCQKL